MKTQYPAKPSRRHYPEKGEVTLRDAAGIIVREQRAAAARCSKARRSKRKPGGYGGIHGPLPSKIQQRIAAVVERARENGTLGPTVT